MTLVEREEDIKALDDAYSASAQGRDNVVIVTAGVATGKTGLLHAAVKRAAQRGAMVLTATGSQAERGLRLGILRQLMQNPVFTGIPGFAVGPLPDDPPAPRCRPADPPSAELLPADSPPLVVLPGGLRRNGAAPARAAAAEKAAGVYPVDLEGAPVGLTRTEMAVLDRVCATLLRQAGEQPVVIAVDDVQFADEASRQALLYLQRRLRFTRVLFILTETPHTLCTRYDAFRAEVTRATLTSHRRLVPLTRDGVARLLAAALGPAAARDHAATFHSISGGNPLLVNALIDDYRAARRAGQGADRSDGSPAGPEFRRAFVSCLRRGESLLLAVSRWLAVLGGVKVPGATTTTLVSELLDITPAAVQQALDALEMAGLVRDGRLPHPAAGQALIDGLPPERVADMHLRAARLLHDHDADAATVSDHLVAADRLSPGLIEGWAVDVLRRAAQEDLAVGRIDIAARRLDLAARSSRDEAERTAVTSLLLRAEWLCQPSAATRHLDRLRAAHAQGRLSEDDVFHLAKILIWYGRVDEVAAILTALIGPRADGRDGTDHLSLAAYWIAFICPPVGERLLPPVDTLGPPKGAERTVWANCVRNLQRIRSGGPHAEIIDSAERILRTCPLSEQTFDISVSALLALLYVDSNDRAEFWCEALLADAVRRRARAWEAMFGAIYAKILVRRGDLPRAARQARGVYELFSPRGWGAAIGLPLAVRVAAATRLGRYDEAAALLRLPVPPSTFQTQFGLFYLYERGVYHLATDRIAAAIADFGRCGELARRWDVDLPAALPWRLGLAQAHLAVGERDVARGLIEEQKGLSCQGGGRTRALTMVCEGMLADPAARVRILQDAVRLLEADGDVFELARTKRLLSSAFEELGETERARSAARQAGELAARCQAEWLLFDLTVDGEPALSGVRVPRWRVDTLSKAEQKVATLAAQGHTNREIGATLFITVSTVEQHLTRVYRKLQVKRRTDLPAALQRYAAARGALSFHDRPLEDLPGDPLRDCG